MGARANASKPEQIAWVGGIFSAIVASGCCWLPLLLIAFGFSSVAVSATLEPYRPFFILLTLFFLGAAFYFAYRPRKTCTTAASGENCCPAAAAKRWSFQKFNRAILWVVTAVAIAFLFFPSYVGLIPRSSDSWVGRDDLDLLALKIDGMTCESCGTGLEKSLAKLTGVEAAKVSFETKKAVIGIPKGAETPRTGILAVIKASGFSGQFTSLTRRIIPIEGMTCEACASQTQEVLAQIPGVTSVEVNHQEKRAIVLEDSSVDSEAIIKAIVDSGYRVPANGTVKPVSNLP